MNCLLRISLLFFFLSAHFYSLGVTTSENYVTNGYYLGSIATITDKNGSILQTNRYLSGGLPQTAMTVNDRFIDNHLYCSMQYTGTHSMGFYDNTARIYDAILTRFTTQDPLSEKYPDFSPYASRANNPMKYVDNDGSEVKPLGNEELEMIRNTLPKYTRNYVQLYENGMIDFLLLNSCPENNMNIINLKLLVNSNTVVEVRLSNNFSYVDQNGTKGTAEMKYYSFDPKYDLESDKDLSGETITGTSTGENGFLGKTLFPDNYGFQNSPNKNIIVIINNNLSQAGAAEIYSHEANGHALLYILNGGNHKGASHQFVRGLCLDGNKNLVKMIINSKKETIKNMK